MAPRRSNGQAEHLELLPRPAHPDAEDEPAAADAIQGGRHAGGLERMAVGQHDHGEAQLHAAGQPGEPGERGERIVERAPDSGPARRA